MPTDPSAHLAVIADHLDRYHEEVGNLVPGFTTSQHDDIAAALVEAERSLRTSARLIRRAAKMVTSVR